MSTKRKGDAEARRLSEGMMDQRKKQKTQQDKAREARVKKRESNKRKQAALLLREVQAATTADAATAADAATTALDESDSESDSERATAATTATTADAATTAASDSESDTNTTDCTDDEFHWYLDEANNGRYLKTEAQIMRMSLEQIKTYHDIVKEKIRNDSMTTLTLVQHAQQEHDNIEQQRKHDLEFLKAYSMTAESLNLHEVNLRLLEKTEQFASQEVKDILQPICPSQTGTELTNITEYLTSAAALINERTPKEMVFNTVNLRDLDVGDVVTDGITKKSGRIKEVERNESQDIQSYRIESDYAELNDTNRNRDNLVADRDNWTNVQRNFYYPPKDEFINVTAATSKRCAQKLGGAIVHDKDNAHFIIIGREDDFKTCCIDSDADEEQIKTEVVNYRHKFRNIDWVKACRDQNRVVDADVGVNDNKLSKYKPTIDGKQRHPRKSRTTTTTSATTTTTDASNPPNPFDPYASSSMYNPNCCRCGIKLSF